jgi:WD40 repeat protein
VRYRIFISSPGDVAAERRIAAEVIHRLDGELSQIRLEVYLSDKSLYWAHDSPQASIPDPLDFDLVIALFWSRIGTLLEGDRYLDENGDPQTGTQYECSRAILAARAAVVAGEEPRPGVLVYRSTRGVLYRAESADEDRAQHEALKRFFARWFKGDDGLYRGYARKYDGPADFEQHIERDLRLWLGSQSRELAWNVALRGSPFRGLEPFGRRHAEVYFGREDEVRSAVELVFAAERDGFGVLWILGASGSGKSSLLHAGLLPAIEHADPDLRTTIFTPAELGPNAASGMAARLLDAVPELLQGSHPDAASLAALLAVENPEPGLRALITALDRWAQSRARDASPMVPPRTRLLIAVDQAEAWLVERSTEERAWWSRTLIAWVGSGRVLLVLGARLDFEANLRRDPDLRPLLEAEPVRTLLMWRLTARQRLKMIEGPCDAAGLQLETGIEGRSLRDEIEADTQGDDSLPMLQFVLQSLFDQAQSRDETLLRLSDYDALGKAAGALSAVADEALAALPDEVAEALPHLLRELIDFNPYSDARIVVSQACQLRMLARDERMLALVEKFSSPECRFLTVSDIEGERYVRIAHESLLRNWSRAQVLVEQEARWFDTRSRLKIELKRWQNASSDERPALLLSGLDLQEAIELKRQWPLEPALVEFIRKSERAGAFRLKMRVVFSSVVGFLFAALALVAWTQSSRSLSALEQASRHALGIAYENAAKGDMRTATAYVAQAMSYMPSESAEVFASTLLNAYGGEMPVAGAKTYAVCRRTLDTTGSDLSEEIVVDAIVADRKRNGEIHGFSYAKRLVVSSSGDAYFEIRSALNQEVLSVYSGVASRVTHLILDDTSHYLLVGLADGTLRVWDMDQEKFHGSVIRLNGRLHSAVISVDGLRMFGTTRDGGVERYLLWDLVDGRVIVESQRPAAADPFGASAVRAGNSAPTRLMFSASGNRAAVLAGGSILLFDAAGARRLPLPSGDATATAAAFSPDGLMLAVVTDNGEVRVVDVVDNRILHSRWISQRDVECIGISADNRYIGLRTRKGKQLNFELSTTRLHEVRYRTKRPEAAAVLAVDASGESVAVADEGHLQVFSVRDGVAAGPSLEHRAGVGFSRFSGAGDLLVSIDGAQVLRVWDWRTGRLKCHRTLGGGAPFFSRFSDDAERLVTFHYDGGIRLLDSRSCRDAGYGHRPEETRIPFYFEEVFNHATADFRDDYLASHVSEDGLNAIALRSPFAVEMVNLKNGHQFLAPEHPGSGIVTHARFVGRTRQVAIATLDGHLRLWEPDARSGRNRRVEIGKPRDLPVASLHSDAEGRRMAVVYADGELLVVSLGKNIRLIRIATGLGAIESLRFTPDGARIVAVGQDRRVGVWSAVDGLALSPLLRGERSFDYLRVTADGGLLAAIGECACASFWFLKLPIADDNHEAARILFDLSGKTFSPDGRLIDKESVYAPTGSAKALDREPAHPPFVSIAQGILDGDIERAASAYLGRSARDAASAEIDWILSRRAALARDVRRRQTLLHDAYRTDRSHPLILLAMSVFETDFATRRSWHCLSLARVGDDAGMATRAAEILAMDGEASMAAVAARMALSQDPTRTAAKRWSDRGPALLRSMPISDALRSLCRNAGSG